MRFPRNTYGTVTSRMLHIQSMLHVHMCYTRSNVLHRRTCYVHSDMFGS
jgi:hypothetical protein